MELEGAAKHINPVTLSAVAPAVLAEGRATEDELKIRKEPAPKHGLSTSSLISG